MKKKLSNFDYQPNLIETQIISEKKNNLNETQLNFDKKDVFTILMPPPNVTGKLHLGHALNNFLQDSLIRYNKLKGKKTIWIPGFDHAGIATEILVRKWIKKNNWKVKDDQELQKYFHKWVDEKQAAILKQWNRLGLEINEEYLSFTFDSNFQKIVKKTFIKLYDQKLIYQDYKLVNMDMQLQTAIANIEVVHKKKNGKMYYIKYFSNNKEKYLEIATTRPETIFADQALIIHPDDKRYQNLDFNYVINPLNKNKIPILKSKLISPEFGTGIVKCTPGHDFNDFEIGKEHNLNPQICFNKKGILNNLANEFEGKHYSNAKEEILKKLKQNKNLTKVVDIQHNVPYSIKTDTIVEPLLSKQWFVKTKKWAQQMLENKDNINFIPKKYHKNFTDWMEKCEDWCISRQLKWGHRLPVFYNKNEIYVGQEKPQKENWVQSQDVLDTWFSSGLWNLVNFGWNNPERKDLTKFLPIDYLVTSYDIIFFWIAKMLFLSFHFEKMIPFKNILIHGLIRTEDNQKMSKSKGNVIDPLNLVEKYGSDSLRLYLLGNHKIGNDLKFQETKIIQANQFCNKIWNINKFIETQTKDIKINPNMEYKNELNIYIFKKFQTVIANFEITWKKHQWSLGIQNIINFVWKDFSNFYIETAKEILKDEKNKEETLNAMHFIWKNILLNIHPFLPFLTQFLWKKNYQNQDILKNEINLNSKVIKTETPLIDTLFSLINEIKEINSKGKKQFLNLKILTSKVDFYLKNKNILNLFLKKHQAKVEEIEKSEIEKVIILDQIKSTTILKEELERIKKELLRSENILKNKNFIAKAKKEIVEKEKEKLNYWKKQFDNLLKKIQEK